MNNNWNRSDGNTIWSFLLAVIVLVCVFALGLNINDALTAPSQNYKLTAETDIETKKAAFDLQLYEEEILAKIAEVRSQSESNTLKQAQDAEFHGKMLGAFAFGVEALFLSLAVVVVSYGIASSFRRAQPQAPAQPQNAQFESRTRGPQSPAGQRARQEEIRKREQELNEKRMQELIPNSKLMWSANKDAEQHRRPRSLAGD